ncbi:MAG: phosphotransferase [Clostridia bacterium]|nr:phosphotransferase [Clostridia bacterium]
MEQKPKPTTEELRAVLNALGRTDASTAKITAFTAEEDGAEYAVWRIDGDETAVLKRAKAFEIACYETYFRSGTPYVPALLGTCRIGDDDWLLTEYCEGRDLCRCDRPRLVKAIDALAGLQNAFWERADLYGSCVTMERAEKAVEDRGKYLGSERLERAYAEFLRVYRETPRTLSHEDLLPINVLADETRAVLIDWEYAGILPYAGPFARLIAHGREDETALFHLTRADRDFAIESYYERLPQKHGISYADYRRTLDHFLFYEYCEWIMLGNRYDARGDERFGYYSDLAERAADRLLQ